MNPGPSPTHTGWAWISAGIAVAVTVPPLVAMVMLLEDYGLALFLIAPGWMGAVAGWLRTRRGRPSVWRVLIHGQWTLLLAIATVLVVAIEGVICLAMAWPLLAVMVLPGSLLGCWLGRCWHERGTGALLLAIGAVLPLVSWGERQLGEPPERPVRSVIDIAAPPEVVWRSVIAVPDLPPPDGIFALGIAAPLRATLSGTGTGAIRRCTFTTGDFVEPITVWDEPRRLAFDVVAQPHPMVETSLWGRIEPAHLDHTLRSRRGEFRLEPLPGGGTRLHGTTWYQLDMAPQAYWRWWSDTMIQAIHQRVLRRIAAAAEAEHAAGR